MLECLLCPLLSENPSLVHFFHETPFGGLGCAENNAASDWLGSNRHGWPAAG